MKRIFVAMTVCTASLIIAAQQPGSTIPLPAAPTKAQLYAVVSKNLELERYIVAVINQDEWFAEKLKEAGIADISKTPSNQPLPYDTLTGWKGQKQFKLLLVDTTKPSRSEELAERMTKLEKKLDDGMKTVALNSAMIQGTMKRIADKVDPQNGAHGDDSADVPDKPTVPAPSAATEKTKKPFLLELDEVFKPK